MWAAHQSPVPFKAQLTPNNHGSGCDVQTSGLRTEEGSRPNRHADDETLEDTHGAKLPGNVPREGFSELATPCTPRYTHVTRGIMRENIYTPAGTRSAPIKNGVKLSSDW